LTSIFVRTEVSRPHSGFTHSPGARRNALPPAAEWADANREMALPSQTACFAVK